jgi:Ca-activated chloride channel family protein
LLPVLFLLSAIAVNLAYIQVVNAKVQIVTDVSVRAAGAAYVESGDEAAGLAAAQQLASLNPIESNVLHIASGDLEFGLSQRNAHDIAYTFTPGVNGNSVRLTTNSFASGSGGASQPFFTISGANFDIRPVCKAAHSQSTLDVCVIVDRSGSMAFAADESSGSGTPAAAPADWSFGDAAPPQSRWLDLVAAVNSFCNELNQTSKIERVALCGYSNNASRLVDLTDTYQQISDALNVISSSYANGYTNVGDGIEKGVSAVTDLDYARPWATNALVLMSDGNHNTGTDPIAAANQAVLDRIPIYTVSFSSEANQALMQQIADMTGGRHYHAIDAAQLNEAFRAIARRLPSMLTE